MKYIKKDLLMNYILSRNNPTRMKAFLKNPLAPLTPRMPNTSVFYQDDQILDQHLIQLKNTAFFDFIDQQNIKLINNQKRHQALKSSFQKHLKIKPIVSATRTKVAEPQGNSLKNKRIFDAWKSLIYDKSSFLTYIQIEEMVELSSSEDLQQNKAILMHLYRFLHLTKDWQLQDLNQVRRGLEKVIEGKILELFPNNLDQYYEIRNSKKENKFGKHLEKIEEKEKKEFDKNTSK